MKWKFIFAVYQVEKETNIPKTIEELEILSCLKISGAFRAMDEEHAAKQALKSIRRCMRKENRPSP